MQQIIILTFLTAVSSRARLIDVHPSYGTCHDDYPNATSSSTFDKLDIQPYPVPFKEREQLNISVQFTINEMIPSGANITIEILSRMDSILPIKIPCYKFQNGHFSTSCEFEADYLLDKFSDLLCQDNQTCSTPIQPGVYGGEIPMKYFIPELPDFVAEVVIPPTLPDTWEFRYLVHYEGSIHSCFYADIEIQEPVYDQLAPNITTAKLEPNITLAYATTTTTTPNSSTAIGATSLMMFYTFSLLLVHSLFVNK